MRVKTYCSSIAITAIAGAMAISSAGAQTNPAPAQTPSTMPAPAGTSGQTTTPDTAATLGGMPAPNATAPASTTLTQWIAADPDRKTLTSLIQAAGIGDMLSQPGPVTIFAPDDAGFSRLAPGTLDTLMKPENKASLVDILKYHMVQGALTTAVLQAMIKQGGGTATLTTLQGQTLTASQANGTILLTDANGNKSYVTKPSATESNGVLEYVNGVVGPKVGQGS